MPNRIMQKVIKDEFGRLKTSHDIIRSLLRTENEKTFGEIRKFLKEKGIPYSNNKGLDLALKSMIKRGEIGKHEVAGKSHPTYFYKSKELDYIATLGDEFKRGVIHGISKFPIPERIDTESEEEYFVTKLIHIYGFYMLYTQILSW